MLISRQGFKELVVNRWLVFAVIGLILASLLMLRPIPSIYASNDTGRYVTELNYFCEGRLDNVGGQLRQIGRSLMYDLTGSCLFRTERLFLFIAALSFPAAFLCFGRWKRDDLLIALSSTFSVYGLELMTNALRSSLALFFFCGALALGRTRLFLSAAIFGLASLLHSSFFFFFPILYFVWSRSPSRRTAHFLAFAILIIIGLQLLLNQSMVTALFSDVSKLTQSYAAIYNRNINSSFILFLAFPTVFIFISRLIFDRSRMTSIERFSFIYLISVIVFSFIVFPLISYRFALIAVPLQLFIVLLSDERPLKAGKVILAFFVAHLAFMLTVSSYYQELLS